MKIINICLFLFCSFSAFSQTDIIEMRSRNASLKKYVKSTKVKSYDHVASNFGMAPMPEIKTAVLDSIKAVSDSVAVVYTSNYCSRRPVLEPMFFLDSNGNELNERPARTYPNPRVGHLWRPGADTVVNHPIFTRRHSLDSVKEVIDRDYNFNLPSDSIRFIGFDNGTGFSNSDAIKRTRHRRSKKNSFGWEIIFMIVSPMMLLFGMSKYVIPKSIN